MMVLVAVSRRKLELFSQLLGFRESRGNARLESASPSTSADGVPIGWYEFHDACMHEDDLVKGQYAQATDETSVVDPLRCCVSRT